MLKGYIKADGRPAILLALKNGHEIECIVDTGYNGSLLLRQSLNENSALRSTGVILPIKGAFGINTGEVFECDLVWFDVSIKVNAMRADTGENLVGMGLLTPLRVEIDAMKDVVELRK